MWVILLEIATYMHFCIQASMRCSSGDTNGFLFKQLSTYFSIPMGSSCRNSTRTESRYQCTGNVYSTKCLQPKILMLCILYALQLFSPNIHVSHIHCHVIYISNSHKLKSKQKNQSNAVSIQMPFKLNHSSTPFIVNNINNSISIYTNKFASP